MLDLGRPPEGVDAQPVRDAAGGHISCGELQVRLIHLLMVAPGQFESGMDSVFTAVICTHT